MLRRPLPLTLLALLSSLAGPLVAKEFSLTESKSPFVIRHTGDKVQWMPWGDAAFKRAKGEDKPIFVYVGYTGCYWCEQMRVESFSVDGETTRLINEQFIPVLIDKDEYPGLNNIFMTYAEVNRNGAGWPLCVWLTPDLTPFSVGGYFGLTTSGKRASLKTAIEHINEQWEKRSDYVKEQSERDIKKIQDVIDKLHAFRKQVDPNEIASRAVEALSANFDPTRGGFSSNVGFPNPSALDFLAESLDDYPPDGFRGSQVRRMLLKTVKGIVYGGLYDQIGDGLFRYTMDSGWEAPSFEKDLVSQARLASSFIHIAERASDSILQEYAIRVLEFVMGSLRLPSGLFAHGFEAQSAPPSGDDRPRQGAYYTWTAKELESILSPEEKEAFFAVFSIKENGNLPLSLNPQLKELGNMNVPRLDEEALNSGKFNPNLLASAMKKVAEARAKRSPPQRFDTAFTGANALFISALARGGLEFKRNDFLHAAAEAGDTLWEDRYDPASARLYHFSPEDTEGEPPIVATDYACLVAAYLDLHDATGESKWLDRATRIQDAQLALFWDIAGTGIHELPENAPYAPLKVLSGADRVLPASNSLGILNLVKIYKLTKNPVYLQRARAIADLFSGRVEKTPLFSLPLLRGMRQLEELKEVGQNP